MVDRAFTSASGSGRQIFWTALSERRGELEFGWRAKPETDAFGHEPALVARTPTPAKLLGFVKFVGTRWCNDARCYHPPAWHNQAVTAAPRQSTKANDKTNNFRHRNSIRWTRGMPVRRGQEVQALRWRAGNVALNRAPDLATAPSFTSFSRTG
jgi:hypothetical protein